MATFNSWLKKQVDRKDHVGDLAYDIEDDASLPANKEGWLEYLVANHACEAAIRAFQQAWCEYEALKARHGRRTSTAKSATDEVSIGFLMFTANDSPSSPIHTDIPFRCLLQTCHPPHPSTLLPVAGP